MMGHLHRLITALMCGITSTYERGAAAQPGTALEIMVGKRHQLASKAATSTASHKSCAMQSTPSTPTPLPAVDWAATATAPGRRIPCGRWRPKSLGKP